MKINLLYIIIHKSYMFCCGHEDYPQSVNYRVSVFLSISLFFILFPLLNLGRNKIPLFDVILSSGIKGTIGIAITLLLLVYLLISLSGIVKKSIKYSHSHEINDTLSNIIFYGYVIGSFLLFQFSLWTNMS